MRVLVATTCSPDDRKTLSVVRALATSGVEVAVGGDRFEGRAFHSRFARGKATYPHPATDLDGFAHSLLEHVRASNYDVLLPTSDDTMAALADRADDFAGRVALPVPDRAAVESTRDKLKTLELATRLGLETPATFCPQDADDLRSIADEIGYPCVVKPRSGAGALGIRIPASRRDLMDCFQGGVDGSQLVQEYVPGEVHDVCTLFNRGEPRAALTQKRLRMFPSTGGAGILNETTDEPELRERAIALLGRLRWHGPAQVEFKVDGGGCAHLLEVNGRFWGTLDLAVAAGVNLPLLACRMAADGDVDPVRSYRVGQRFRWPFPYALLVALETGRWWDSIWPFVRPDRRATSDLWLSDPLPLLAESVAILRRLCRRRGRMLRDDAC
jgi:predicted ATP-grasp superfamily ATP-dependent carboligase